MHDKRLSSTGETVAAHKRTGGEQSLLSRDRQWKHRRHLGPSNRRGCAQHQISLTKGPGAHASGSSDIVRKLARTSVRASASGRPFNLKAQPRSSGRWIAWIPEENRGQRHFLVDNARRPSCAAARRRVCCEHPCRRPPSPAGERTRSSRRTGRDGTRRIPPDVRTKYDAVMAELIGEDARRSRFSCCIDAAGPTSDGVVARLSRARGRNDRRERSSDLVRLRARGGRARGPRPRSPSSATNARSPTGRRRGT